MADGKCDRCGGKEGLFGSSLMTFHMKKRIGDGYMQKPEFTLCDKCRDIVLILIERRQDIERIKNSIKYVKPYCEVCGHRHCSKCKVYFHVDDDAFTIKRVKGKDIMNSICRGCHNGIMREYMRKKREKEKEEEMIQMANDSWVDED